MKSVLSTGPKMGWADNHVFELVAGVPFPVAGSGSTISNVNSGCSHPGTRVARLRIVNQKSSTDITPVAFNINTQCNGIITYPHSGSYYRTGIFGFIVGTSTYADISDSTQHYSYNTSGTCFNNITLNPTPVTPTISSISPTTINAGIGSELTINGTGFGNYKGANGNVFFHNADTTDNAFYGLDALDHLSTTWSDTQILIHLPSRSRDPGTSKVFTPAGGSIQVKNSGNLNSASSTQQLNINYAIKEVLYPNIKRRQCLARYKCNNGILYYFGIANI
jgi:hypothetical protein